MTGYDYGNARLRAMRSNLLDMGDYTALVAVGSFDAFLGALHATSYEPDLEAARRVHDSGRSRAWVGARSELMFHEGPRETRSLGVATRITWEIATNIAAMKESRLGCQDSSKKGHPVEREKGGNYGTSWHLRA